MPKSVPSPNNFHAPNAETNTIAPGNMEPLLHLSTAQSLFSFSKCDFRIKQEMTLLWSFVDGDKLCSLEYYIMMTISFVVFKLLAQTSLTSCMVNLHSQYIFEKTRVPSCIQHLHVLSLSAADGHIYSFIIHVLSFFNITDRQLYWFLKMLCMRVVILVMYFNSR